MYNGSEVVCVHDLGIAGGSAIGAQRQPEFAPRLDGLRLILGNKNVKLLIRVLNAVMIVWLYELIIHIYTLL